MSILYASIISIGGYLLLRTYIYSVNEELGKRTALNSQQSIEFQLKERLSSLVQKSAVYCDVTFHSVENKVHLLASSANNVLKNPENYKPRPVAPPNPYKQGIFTAQVQYVPNIDRTAYQREMPLLGNMQGLMLSLVTNISEITTCYAGSELGYIIVVDDQPKKLGPIVDCRTRPWYKLASESGELIWTDVYSEAYGKGPVITCAMPFYHKNGDIAGVTGVEMMLSTLSDLVRDARVDELGASFIIDDRGTILVHDEKDAPLLENLTFGGTQLATSNVGTQLAASNVGTQLAASNVGTQLAASNVEKQFMASVKTVYLNSKEYFIAFAPIHLNIREQSSTSSSQKKLYFASIVETSVVNAPAIENTDSILALTDTALRNINVIIFLFIALLIMINIAIFYIVRIFANKFSETITSPIALLEESVKIIANGQLDHHIDLKTNDELQDLGTSVNKMATDLQIYIQNLQKVTAEKERIDTELDLARRIQDSMLPDIHPHFSGYAEFDLCAFIQPAKEIGGDFYDFFFIEPQVLALVIGDVSGHGVPAALYMGTVKNLIKDHAKSGKSPCEVCESVNNLLCESNDEGMFATVFLAYINIHTGYLSFVNAGHLPPLISSEQRLVFLDSTPNMMLGVRENQTFLQFDRYMGKNDKLFLYTDGVTEAINGKDELFSAYRLLEVANKYTSLNMKQFCGSLRAEVEAFTSGASAIDDYTTLGIELKFPLSNHV